MTIGNTKNFIVQRIIRDYCEQIYTNKFGNLDEIDKFLESYNLLKLNHKEIETLNRLITYRDILTATKNFH